MCVSDSDDEINLSLEGLAPDLETLKKAQRVVVIPKWEWVVRKFTSDARQLENANTELQSAQLLALFEGISVRSHS